MSFANATRMANKQMQLTSGSMAESTAAASGIIVGRSARQLAALPLATDL